MWNNLEANKKLPKPTQGQANKENVLPSNAQSFYTTLTSELKNMSTKLFCGTSSLLGTSGRGTSTGWSQGYQVWRKKKIDGKDSVEMEGCTWYWVPDFVCPKGTFSGMNMTYKPEDHTKWLCKKKYWVNQKRCNDGTGNGNETCDPPPTSNGTEATLIPTEKVKQVLMTSHGMMEMQADAFLALLN